MDNDVETATVNFSLRPDGILESITKPGAIEGLAEAEENLAAISQLCGEKLRPMLGDITGLKSQNREARRRYATTVLTTAVALVVGSRIARLVGSFYLGLNKPGVPTKLFADRTSALAWLKNYPPVDSSRSR